MVSAGSGHTCVLDNKSSLGCWGMVWNGTEHTKVLAEVDVGWQVRVRDVASGWSHLCVLSINGNVGCWGLNNAGQTDIPGVVHHEHV